MKWMDRMVWRRAARLGLLSLLLCLNGETTCGQSIDLEDGAMRRARQFEPIIIDAAKKYGVNPHLLWVIAYLETRFDPKLTSHVGARGLMQFMPGTASRYGLGNPYDSIAAIDAAARYVRDLTTCFDNRADLVLAAYNSGETTVTAYMTGRTIRTGGRTINPKAIITGGIPPYRETRSYVARGLKLLERLSATPVLAKQMPIAITSESATIEEQALPRSPIRKSVRTDSEPEQGEIEAENSRNATTRRSIYFGGESKTEARRNSKFP